MSGAYGVRPLLLACFAASGFAALAYQTVWMRWALARFGVNASVTATVLAAFMGGLAIGSLAAGPLLARAGRRFGWGALRVYGVAELAIGAGGLLVPLLMDAARSLLLATGAADGLAYSVVGALALAAILVPFSVAMGLTYPAAVAALRGGTAGGGFGVLYVANVCGALAGAVATPVVLIETFGFRATGWIAAALNGAVAVAAFRASRGEPPAEASAPAATVPAGRRLRLALFATGFATMGLEVVWMRLYPTIVGTFVYSFALIVASYLLATAAGAAAYRARRSREPAARLELFGPWLAAAAILPLLSASITLRVAHPWMLVALGLAPFCALLGYLTPLLVDREAGDDPSRVGRVYAINLAGCLAGPLVAGYVLLPWLGTRGATLALALPLAALAMGRGLARPGVVLSTLAAGGAAAAVWGSTTLFEEQFPARQVRHDHVATVVAANDGAKKHLFVNGVGMTELTTITKVMAHFPAAHLDRQAAGPLDALVVCFGMGTSFRSLAAWDAHVTAVELVPSVTAMFGYYFPDGPALLARPGRRMRLIHDDGRRFLDRSPDTFDLVTIDPPPPVEAAGSSLLYSTEFYASARRRMKPGAILQMWLPGGDRETVGAVAAALVASFPHVRAFPSMEGFGYHFLASKSAIPDLDARALAARLPEAARRDLTEWTRATPEAIFASMVEQELAISSLTAVARPITDDRPVNEFFVLRRLGRGEEPPPRDAVGRR